MGVASCIRSIFNEAENDDIIAAQGRRSHSGWSSFDWTTFQRRFKIFSANQKSNQIHG